MSTLERERLPSHSAPPVKKVNWFSSLVPSESEYIFADVIILFFRHGDDFVVMDKSGRFLRFNSTGDFVDLLAEIDAYLANGFCIKDNAALMALSGVVLDHERRTICDDWLEWIELDGSSWRKQREEKKKAEEAQ